MNRDSAISIQAKLGMAGPSGVRAGHDKYLSWCYRSGDGAAAVTLELMSDASDMGTAGHELNVIRLRSDVPTTQPNGCGQLAPQMPLSTAGGLRLGLAPAAVAALLGSPSHHAGDSLVFAFVSKEYMARSSREYATWNTPKYRKDCFGGGEPFVDVGATVTVHFRDQHAIEIRLERYDQSTC